MNPKICRKYSKTRKVGAWTLGARKNQNKSKKLHIRKEISRSIVFGWRSKYRFRNLWCEMGKVLGFILLLENSRKRKHISYMNHSCGWILKIEYPSHGFLEIDLSIEIALWLPKPYKLRSQMVYIAKQIKICTLIKYVVSEEMRECQAIYLLQLQLTLLGSQAQFSSVLNSL